jgi:hypothetical protein
MSEERNLSTADIASDEKTGDEEPTRDEMAREDVRAAESPSTDDSREPLFAKQESSSFRDRWQEVQAGFVDEPRQAAQDADSLVAELMQKLADSFAKEREKLERQWDRGDDVSTEDLRLALQRYRSFFDRLLSA